MFLSLNIALLLFWLEIADAETKVQAHKGQSEIIFLGTGTSEGIPRVSCLTAESKICEVSHPSITFLQRICQITRDILSPQLLLWSEILHPFVFLGLLKSICAWRQEQ